MRPEWERELCMVKKAETSLDNVTMMPFGYTVLFRCICRSCEVGYPMLLKIWNESNKFSTIVQEKAREEGYENIFLLMFWIGEITHRHLIFGSLYKTKYILSKNQQISHNRYNHRYMVGLVPNIRVYKFQWLRYLKAIFTKNAFYDFY